MWLSPREKNGSSSGVINHQRPPRCARVKKPDPPDVCSVADAVVRSGVQVAATREPARNDRRGIEWLMALTYGQIGGE
jgi:hypothetical protein